MMTTARSHSVRRLPLIVCAVMLLTLLLPGGVAWGNSPELRNIQPVGMQRGTERVVNFRGPRVGPAVQLLSHDAGITASAFEMVDANHVRVTVRIDEEARLGEHRLRLRTPRGVSNLATFQVGAMPVVREQEPNNLIDEAQAVELGTTVHGVVTNEDVDYFVVEAAAGQRIVAEAQAMRLGRILFDPHVSIYDMDRFTLAASDGTPFSGSDGVAAAVAPEDGKYLIEMRESAYGGNGNSHYRLNIGDFPRPLLAFPFGGRPGEAIDVRFLGDPTGPITQRVELPDEPVERHGIFAAEGARLAPTPNLVRVVDMPSVRREGSPLTHTDAQPIEPGPPFAVDGIIDQPRQIHWFRFKARQGQPLDLQTYARAFGSPLDPVIAVHDAEGNQLAANDDNDGSLDSYLRFDPPADGEYVVRIWDQLLRGGETYGYRMEVTPTRPELAISIPAVARNDTQSRQWVAVPRGNRWTFRVRIDRRNIGGDVELYCEDLPDGVTMHAPVIEQGMNQAAVVFEAAEDAELSGRLGRLMVRHVEREQVSGQYSQQINLIHQNNIGTFHATHVQRMPLVVTERAPFSIRIVEPEVPLLQAGPMNLRIVAEREEGFAAPINLAIEYRPPGFNARASVTIPEGQSEIDYPVNAAGNARAGDHRIAVLGWANVDGGPLFVGSQLATLRIEPLRVGGAIQLTAVEQGETARVPVSLNQQHAFEGEATLTLNGLPAEATAEPVTITAETEEVVFDVTTTEATPVGQHRSLFVTFSQGSGEQVMRHNLAGGGVLRVDTPREPEPEPQAEVPEPEAEPEPEQEQEPERPLSRLEQLRKELAEQREAE